MEKIVATFRTVTPMFLGGAEPNRRAEVRAPSIKGALRFWYRAIDPSYAAWESKIFGGSGADEGQAAFLLRVMSPLRESAPWDTGAMARYDMQHPSTPAGLSQRQRRGWTLNGLRYFSFPLKMPPNDRRSISDGREFKMELMFSVRADDEALRRAAAAFWLFSRLGALGTRSRRAFGSLAVANVEVSPRLGAIAPLAFSARTNGAAGWAEDFVTGYRLIRGWLRGDGMGSHSVLSGGTLRVLPTPHPTWRDAMHEAGLAMQIFRQRFQSDYDTVKAHICHHDARAAAVANSAVTPLSLTSAPRRVAFGLPLTFRYSSLEYQLKDANGKLRFRDNGDPIMRTPETTFFGDRDSAHPNEVHQRMASPIHVRILRLGDGYHSLFLRLRAPTFSRHFEQKDRQLRRPITAPLNPQAILNDFWASLPNGIEVAL